MASNSLACRNPAIRGLRRSLRNGLHQGADHEDAYPASRPTPGDVCRAEAERLNQLGLGDAEDLTLVETRVERTDSTIRLVHVFEYGRQKARLLTEPYEAYGGEEAEE